MAALLGILISLERHILDWIQFRERFLGFTKGTKCSNYITQLMELPSLPLVGFSVW